ncbi:hypothetical protein [[Flexibacter] sp. ATCC 35208]|uniref:hypothetical protein n=1 Tax=[Flexibacter] sp. ATCC 35208 TaxID=1936242 RepID=UPI0009D4CFBB|nr:hypothetical protein [[Flexibacter] sp. ATCC 35208]OMP74460.1 hypothetical protein BW716_35255 [[Flexibacter] sp. ATCC 35208]
MAKTDNLLLKESSGSIGKIMTITQKKSGKMLIGKHRGSSSVPPSEKQLGVQAKFKEGIIYGKAVMADPALKALYAAAVKGDQSAYNLAVRDAYKAPEITKISTDLYTGLIGSTITVRAVDDFKVASVRVAIYSAVGDLIEQGDAVLEANGLDWLYTATVANSAIAGCRVRAVAKDLPANETVYDVTVE